MEYFHSKVATTACVEISPSENISNTIIEPYNYILCTAASIYNQDICVTMQNERLYNVCQTFTGGNTHPNYSQMNQLIATVAANLILDRFPQECGISANDLMTNLVIF